MILNCKTCLHHLSVVPGDHMCRFLSHIGVGRVDSQFGAGLLETSSDGKPSQGGP